MAHPGTTLLGTEIVHPGRVVIGEVKAMLDPGDNTKPVLNVLADGFHMVGVKPLQGLTDRTVVTIGSASQPDVTKQPSDVVFDQCEITSVAGVGKRGIECHSRGYSLLNSLILGFMFQGNDSQAFWSCNGPGPYLLENNQLEGSGENIMFGGADVQSEAHMPRNIIIRGNWVYKPQEWRNFKGSVKNSLEFKEGTNALVENNIFDGCWKDSQAGHMFAITPRNPSGNDDYIQVADITFKGNRTLHHTDGFVINILLQDDSGRATKQTARLIFEHNLFVDAISGLQVLGGVLDYLKFNNNTLPGLKNSFWTSDTTKVKTPFECTNNVFASSYYGAIASGQNASTPKAVFEAVCSPLNFTGNIIQNDKSRVWPDGNTLIPAGSFATVLDENYKYKPDATKGW